MSVNSFPYQLATQGINSNNTYTIATLGYNFQVEIIPIPPTPVEPPQDFIPPSGIFAPQVEEERYYRNKIRVSVEIDGTTYTEEKLVEDVEVDINNVKLAVTSLEDKPKIKISIIK